jgi:hypothetical protein
LHAEEEPEPERKSAFAIGGPSFLGLGQTASDSGSGGYLFDDEPETSGRAWIAALIFVLVAGTVVVAVAQNWHGSRDWARARGTLLAQDLHNWRSGATPPPASEPTVPNKAPSGAAASTAAPNPATPETQQPAQQQPLSDEATAEQNSNGASQAAASPPSANAANAQSGNQGQGENTEFDVAKQASSGTQGPAKAPAVEGKAPPIDTKAAPPANARASKSEAPKAVAKAAATEPQKMEPKKDQGDDLVAQGERFLYGEGVRRDCNQAMVYFRAGAEQQNPKALSRLGALYATGTCVPMDRVMAYNWFSRALVHDSKNQLLEENLNMLWRDMSANERNQVLQPRR